MVSGHFLAGECLKMVIAMLPSLEFGAPVAGASSSQVDENVGKRRVARIRDVGNSLTNGGERGGEFLAASVLFES